MKDHHYAWYKSMIVKQLALLVALFTPIILLFAYLTSPFSAEIWDSTTQLMRTQDMILFQTMEQQISDLNLLQYTLLSDDNILMLQSLYDRFTEQERAQRIGDIQNRLLWLKKSTD